jgi:hypothetical protein
MLRSPGLSFIDWFHRRDWDKPESPLPGRLTVYRIHFKGASLSLLPFSADPRLAWFSKISIAGRNRGITGSCFSSHRVRNSLQS